MRGQERKNSWFSWCCIIILLCSWEKKPTATNRWKKKLKKRGKKITSTAQSRNKSDAEMIIKKKWITNNGRDLIQFSFASASFLPSGPTVKRKFHPNAISDLKTCKCFSFFFFKAKNLFIRNVFCRDLLKQTRKGRSLLHRRTLRMLRLDCETLNRNSVTGEE